MNSTRRRLLRAAGAAATLALASTDTSRAASPPPGVPTATIDASGILSDENGLIVHREVESGGDTAQREGWYWFGVWVRKNLLNDPWPYPRKLTYIEVMDRLEPKHDGVFHRHPTQPKFSNPYDNDYGFSRDQMTSCVAAMGVHGDGDRLRRLWNALPQDPVGGARHSFNGPWVEAFGKRLFSRGDFIGPQHTNHFKRAWNEDPASGAGDSELWANAGLRIAKTLRDQDDTGDDLNLIIMLVLAHLRFPSSISENARSWYAKNRPISYGCYLGSYRAKYGVDYEDAIAMKATMGKGIASGWPIDCSRVLGAVRWYQRTESNANPQLAELYAPIIKAYLE